MKVKLTFHYYRVEQVFSDAGIFRKDGENWRMVPSELQRTGEIQGLPTSRGIVRATNGILCLIEQPTGWFEGHLEYFRPDKAEHVEALQKLVKKKTTTAKPLKTTKLIVDYVNFNI